MRRGEGLCRGSRIIGFLDSYQGFFFKSRDIVGFGMDFFGAIFYAMGISKFLIGDKLSEKEREKDWERERERGEGEKEGERERERRRERGRIPGSIIRLIFVCTCILNFTSLLSFEFDQDIYEHSWIICVLTFMVIVSLALWTW